jgi:hypothetical protein
MPETKRPERNLPIARQAYLLTPKLQERLCALVAAGDYVSVACGHCGIERHTVTRWLQWAEEPQATPELLAFRDAFRAARRIGFGVHARRVAASEDWRAAAWAAERLDPDREAQPPTERRELTGADGGPVQVASVAEGVLAAIDRLAPDAPRRLP